MRQRHNLRIVAAERGKSTLDPSVERAMMEKLQLDAVLAYAREEMIEEAEALGPVWDWLVSIKGLGAGGLAAQLLALIDDIALCDTVSALWRYAGFAVIDGKAERNVKGCKAAYNAKLKATCYNIAMSFLKARTPIYADIYYAEKERQRRLHPEPEKVDGHTVFSNAHIHNRAWRKMIKIFLQNLWVVWRQAEGLPVSEPYAARLGHEHFVTPEQVSAAMVEKIHEAVRRASDFVKNILGMQASHAVKTRDECEPFAV